MDMSLHDSTFAATSRLVRLCRLLDLSDHHLECLRDVGVVPSTGLSPSCVEFFCELLTLFGCDLALAFANIALVADDYEGDGFGALCL
jgi:hypothetical protein